MNNNKGPVRVPTGQAGQVPQPTEYILVRVKIFRLEDFSHCEQTENAISDTQRFENAVNDFVVQKQKDSVKYRIPVQISSMPGEIHVQYGEVKPID